MIKSEAPTAGKTEALVVRLIDAPRAAYRRDDMIARAREIDAEIASLRERACGLAEAGMMAAIDRHTLMHGLRDGGFQDCDEPECTRLRAVLNSDARCTHAARVEVLEAEITRMHTALTSREARP